MQQLQDVEIGGLLASRERSKGMMLFEDCCAYVPRCSKQHDVFSSQAILLVSPLSGSNTRSPPFSDFPWNLTNLYS